MKKWKSRMVLGVIAITMALGLTLFPGLAKADTLADIIALGDTGIRIDDKLFYHFQYIPSGGAPLASQIIFTPITTVGNPGFILNQLWIADVGQIIDSYLTYRVSVFEGGSPIKDVSVSWGGVGKTANGIASLAENVFLGNDQTGPNLANLNLIFNSGIVLFDESLLIDPNTGLPITTMGPIFVIKDFGARGGDGTAQFSSVTNQFSEKVPEPISLILLGSGLAGVGLYRRLRKPKG